MIVTPVRTQIAAAKLRLSGLATCMRLPLGLEPLLRRSMPRNSTARPNHLVVRIFRPLAILARKEHQARVFTAPPVRDAAPPPAGDMTAPPASRTNRAIFPGNQRRNAHSLASAEAGCDSRLRAPERLTRDNHRRFTLRTVSLVYPSIPHTSCASTCLSTYRSPPLTRTRK